jgi:broad specificity phosphatase PhoE
MSKDLWLIRHGESEANQERRIQGWLEYPLTRLGRRQAARLGERLAQDETISSIYSSPLKRAAQTAEIIGNVLDLPVKFEERLKEYNFGPINGLTREEIGARYPEVKAGWDFNEFWEPLPGEEGEPIFEARVRAALDEIVDQMADHTAVAVVTHGGSLNACLRSWLGIQERGWRTFAFDNASISVVQIKTSPQAGPDGKVKHNYRIILLNGITHLKGVRGSPPTWFGSTRGMNVSEEEEER